MGKISSKFLLKKDWIKSFADAEHLLSKEGLIPSDLKEQIQSLQKLGLIESWKSTGAGGGDGLLCWSEKIPELIEDARKLGFWCTYPLVQGRGPEIA